MSSAAHCARANYKNDMWGHAMCLKFTKRPTGQIIKGRMSQNTKGPTGQKTSFLFFSNWISHINHPSIIFFPLKLMWLLSPKICWIYLLKCMLVQSCVQIIFESFLERSVLSFNIKVIILCASRLYKEFIWKKKLRVQNKLK